MKLEGSTRGVNRAVVFIIENKRAKRRVVKVGQRNGRIAQILDGVKEGDMVIDHPSDEVDDDRSVRVR